VSVTSDQDPVGACVDILDEVPASSWPDSTAPTRIERSETSTPAQKEGDQRLTDVSVYVAAPVDGDLRKHHAAGGLEERHTVAVQVWTNDSATTDAYARTIRDVAAAYHADNNDRTAWVDVRPQSGVDDRAGSFYVGGYAVETVRIRFLGFRDW